MLCYYGENTNRVLKMNELKISKVIEMVGRSHYKASPNYDIAFPPRRLKAFLSDYNTKTLDFLKENEFATANKIVEMMTPLFQRDNGKWSVDKKIKFAEAVLSGLRSKIIMFSLNRDSMTDCMILDGLQRCTAWADFIEGKFPVWGDVYFEDIKKSNKIFMNVRLSMLVYEFKNERAAVKFYIDMNEGVTHSPEDIEKARKYLDTLPE